MGGCRGVTEKLNTVLDRTGTFVKFVFQVIAAISVISGIILYPLLTRVKSIEKSVDDIKVELKNKVDDKIYQNTLSNIQKSLDEMKADIKWLVRGRV